MQPRKDGPLILVRLYSRPFINATLEDAFYRYAYESLQAIYLVPVIAKAKGVAFVCHCRIMQDGP